MTYGVNISDITFYIYDIESGDEITNEDVKKRLRELVDQTLTLATKLN